MSILTSREELESVRAAVEVLDRELTGPEPEEPTIADAQARRNGKLTKKTMSSLGNRSLPVTQRCGGNL